MSLTGIAARVGTTTSNIQRLISNGTGSAGLAGRIGMTTSTITNFVNGTASAGVANALGTTTSNAQELRNLIGRDGAIGLIIGLACGRGNPQA